MKKLTNAECIEILKENNTVRIIWLHCRKANAVAMFIAEKFINQGITLDTESIYFASLLHDVMKYNEILGKTTEMHEIEGKKLLEKKDYPKIANLIFKHRTAAILRNELDTWEEKVVFYADKRVLHDKIVSLNERLEDGLKRYKGNPHYTADFETLSALMRKLESQIFKKLGMKPSDINEENVKKFLVEDEY